MGGESERRGTRRLTLTINGVHVSVRPIQSEDDQIRIFASERPSSPARERAQFATSHRFARTFGYIDR
jgi:hypothetical protein